MSYNSHQEGCVLNPGTSIVFNVNFCFSKRKGKEKKADLAARKPEELIIQKEGMGVLGSGPIGELPSRSSSGVRVTTLVWKEGFRKPAALGHGMYFLTMLAVKHGGKLS